MKSHLNVRSLIRMSVYVSALLAAPAIFGAAPDRPQVQAQLLDHAELLCDNCFFGPSYYYYCFQADNKVLIGYQRTRVLNWEDKSKNYLTKAHKAWTVWTPPTTAQLPSVTSWTPVTIYAPYLINAAAYGS